jgi:hypothetical protein
MLNAFCTSGNSPTRRTEEPDFVVENHFTLFLLFPRTKSAESWVEEFLPPDHLTFGQAVVIEARCFWPILEALQIEGYLVVPR